MVSSLITQMLEIMVGAAYSSLILSNRKAISELFPYAIR